MPIISFKKKERHKQREILEEEVHEPNFYTHEEPEPVVYGDINMPMEIEEPDAATTGQLLVDDGSGRERPMTPAEAKSLMNRVPDGLNVPGYQKPGAPPPQPQPQKKNQKNQPVQKQPPQQPPQPQPNVNPPQQPQYYQQQYTQPIPQGQYPTQYVQPPQQMQQPPQQVPVQQPAPSVPPTETVILDDGHHIYIDLPGITRKSLKIVYDNGMLKIDANREPFTEIMKKEIKKVRKIRKNPIKNSITTVPSFLVGKVHFEYLIKRAINEREVSADYNDGILHVTLPYITKGDQINISLSP